MRERVHTLKTWPEPWRAVREGRKTFEVRIDDRGYMVGDVLLLQLFDPGVERAGRRSGRYCNEDGSPLMIDQHVPAEIRKRVTYVLHGGRFGVDMHWVVLGLGEMGESKDV